MGRALRHLSRFLVVALIAPVVPLSLDIVPGWAAPQRTIGQRTAAPPTGPTCATTTLSAGGGHYLAIDASDGSVWAWGQNNGGQLGNGTTVGSGTPVHVVGGASGTAFLSGVTTVAAGLGSSLAAKSDGSVWAWGSINSSSTPLQVAGLKNIVGLAGGFEHALAVDTQGTVWAWGGNTWGQLGNGTNVGSSTPAQVVGPGGSGTLTGMVAVAAGEFHSLALKSDGTIWTWGFGVDGELGNGGFANSTTPVQVSGLSGVLAIGAGSSHSLAVGGDATAWAWGSNAFGDLGDGTTNNSAVPVHVVGPGGSGLLTGVAQMAGGDGFSVASTSSGTAYGWGFNGDNELGNGTATDSPTPVQVAGIGGSGTLSGVTQITAAGSHSGTVQADATVTTWGMQSAGPPNGSSASAQTVTGLPHIAQTVPCPGSAQPGDATTEATVGGGSPDIILIACQTGSPINCATGEFWHSFWDLAVRGRGMPLVLTRTYSSRSASSDGPLGFGWTHSYNIFLTTDPGSGNVTVHEENGSAVTFTSTGSGYQAPSWVFSTLSRNSDATFTYRRKNQTQFIFSAAGRLQQEIDRNGYTTTLAYSASGQLATVTDPAGRQLAFTYSAGHLASVLDPIGRTISYQYDAGGNLTSSTDVGGGARRFTYDGSHRVLSMTDPNGRVTANVYDSVGRVVSQTDPLGQTSHFSYGADTTTITDPNGNATAERFKNNMLLGVTRGFGSPQAATSTYTYDPATLGIASATDPNGNRSGFTYDASGNILSAIDALGRKSSFTYTTRNDLAAATDPLGTTTTFTRDGNGNVLSISRPLVGTGQVAAITASYADTSHPGDVTQVTDATGKTWQYGYDARGGRIRSTDPLNGVTTFQYDGIGRVSAFTSARGNAPGATPSAFTTTLAYNAFGDLTAVTDPLGSATTRQYDANRNMVRATDGNGHSTMNTFDADNELTTVTNPDGSTLKTSYDSDGNVILRTDGLGHSMSFVYDQLSRLIAVTDALNRKTTYGYDGAGNVVNSVDAMNRSTSFSYDKGNQLTRVLYSDGVTPGVALTYDGKGRRIQMVDGTGTASFRYDSLDRLTGYTNGAGQTVSYGYDLRDQVTSMTYPAGQVVARKYDAAGRMTSVTDWLNNTTQFGYDANSNLVSQLYPNGVSETLSYDAADRLSLMTYSSRMGQLSFTEGRDRIGNLTSENIVGEPPNGPVAYSYDSVNRVALANYGNTQQTFQYDSADHLTQAKLGGATAALTYDQADQLTSMTTTASGSPSQSLQFSYDSNGNRVKQTDQHATTTSYTYDQANRLVNYGGTVQYAYNGDGLRMSKTVAAGAEPFTWDLAGQLPALIQDGATRYVTDSHGLPLEQIARDGSVHFYHQDQLGSTRAITNASGQLENVYFYDPYGKVASVRLRGSVVNPFQYAGQYRDAESGFYYLRARYYDPATFQFLSRDPLTALTGAAYAYVNDNPLNRVDPSGLCDWNPFSSGSCEGVIVNGLAQLPGAVVADAQQGQENFVQNFQNGGWIAIGLPLAAAGGIALYGIATGAASVLGALGLGSGGAAGLAAQAGISKVGPAIVLGGIALFAAIVFPLCSWRNSTCAATEPNNLKNVPDIIKRLTTRPTPSPTPIPTPCPSPTYGPPAPTPNL